MLKNQQLTNKEKKKKLEPRKQVEEQQRQKQEEIIKAQTVDYFFNKGEKVFHDMLGAGEVIDVMQVGDSTMYTIDFGAKGKKAMDAQYARLKKI